MLGCSYDRAQQVPGLGVGSVREDNGWLSHGKRRHNKSNICNHVEDTMNKFITTLYIYIMYQEFLCHFDDWKKDDFEIHNKKEVDSQKRASARTVRTKAARDHNLAHFRVLLLADFFNGFKWQ